MRKVILSLVLIPILWLSALQAVAAGISYDNRGRLIVISEDEGLGRQVADLAEKQYQELAQTFRYRPARQLVLYVYVDEKNFRDLAISEDAVGEASPGKPEVRLLGTTPNLLMVVRHELVHIFFLGSLHRPQDVPFWFSEGLAIYFSRPGSESGDYERLAFEGKLPSINSSYLRYHQTSRSSAQGYIIVRFIAERWGEGKVMEIVRRLQDQQRFDKAVTEALGVNSAQLDKLWQRYGSARQAAFRWRVLSSADWLLIGLLSLIAPLIWLVRRWRQGGWADYEEDADS